MTHALRLDPTTVLAKGGMSVAPDGRSYTVSIPAHGHSRTYRTKGM